MDQHGWMDRQLTLDLPLLLPSAPVHVFHHRYCVLITVVMVSITPVRHRGHLLFSPGTCHHIILQRHGLSDSPQRDGHLPVPMGPFVMLLRTILHDLSASDSSVTELDRVVHQFTFQLAVPTFSQLVGLATEVVPAGSFVCSFTSCVSYFTRGVNLPILTGLKL